MANTDYIKEFLVKLGYQVDEADRKKFEEAIGKSEKSTEGLAKNLKSVAVALGTVSSVAAYRLNALYVNAQRIGTSASKLDALRRSVANVGGDANAAAQSVASLAQKLRDNPEGFAGAFKRFGINIRDTNGQIRDTVDLMMELVNSNSFKSLEYYQQSAYMRDLFGIDDLTFRSIRSGEFAREYQKIRDIQAKLGNETDKSAKSVRDFMVGLNDIRNKGSAALDVLVGNLADKLAPALQAVNEKADALLDWYSKLSPESKEVAKNIGSTAVAVGMLAASLKAISILKGLGGILKGGAAAGGAGGAAAGGGLLSKTAALASNPVSWLAALGLGSFAADAYMTSQDADSVMSRETGGDLVGALYNGSINPASHEQATGSWGIIPAARAADLPKSGKVTRGIRNNNPGNLDYVPMWAKQGATRETGNNGRFAAFATPEEGLRALAVQLKRYANAGEDSVYKIIKKYAPETENNTIAYMNSVARDIGTGIHGRLNFSDPQVMEKMMRAIIKFENSGNNPYSDEMMNEAARFGTGHKGKWGGGWGGSANLNQNVNITIYTNDAKETAREVTNVLKRESENNVRLRNARTPSR